VSERRPTIPAERIESCIYLLRGGKVMLDEHLAELYGVETRILVQAVKRNANRFPLDFMFQLSRAEFENLRSQIVISSWGGRRVPPYAFTEQGAAILSGVLRSERAVAANVEIMRAFVRLRRFALSNEVLARKCRRWSISTIANSKSSSTLFAALWRRMFRRDAVALDSDLRSARRRLSAV